MDSFVYRPQTARPKLGIIYCTGLGGELTGCGPPGDTQDLRGGKQLHRRILWSICGYAGSPPDIAAGCGCCAQHWELPEGRVMTQRLAAVVWPRVL